MDYKYSLSILSSAANIWGTGQQVNDEWIADNSTERKTEPEDILDLENYLEFFRVVWGLKEKVFHLKDILLTTF